MTRSKPLRILTRWTRCSNEYKNNKAYCRSRYALAPNLQAHYLQRISSKMPGKTLLEHNGELTSDQTSCERKRKHTRESKWI
jgi:hypothetical protein